jgi:hypothetical protein
MALAYSTTLRDNQLAEIGPLIDGGAGAGLLVLYDGTRPSTGGTVTNEVATLTFSDPSMGTPSGQSVTAAAISPDTSATGGTATWFRVTTSASGFVMDGDVGTSGSDLNLNNNVIPAGANVSVTSFVITAGNP